MDFEGPEWILENHVCASDGSLPFWNACDYKSSTDFIKSIWTALVWRLACEYGGVPAELAEAGKVMLVQNIIHYPDPRLDSAGRPRKVTIDGKSKRVELWQAVEQRCGQLMGCPISFPILSILNLACHLYALNPPSPWTLHVEVNGEEPDVWVHGLKDLPIRINGDDGVAVMNADELARFEEACACVGFKFSQGKNWHSRRFLEINSQSFLHQREDKNWPPGLGRNFRSVRFVNLGLLYGQKKTAQRKGVDDWANPAESPVRLGQSYNDLLLGHPPWLRESLKTEWWALHLQEVRDSGLAAYGPAPLGMGLECDGDWHDLVGYRFGRLVRWFNDLSAEERFKWQLKLQSGRRVLPLYVREAMTLGNMYAFEYVEPVDDGSPGSGLVRSADDLPIPVDLTWTAGVGDKEEPNHMARIHEAYKLSEKIPDQRECRSNPHFVIGLVGVGGLKCPHNCQDLRTQKRVPWSPESVPWVHTGFRWSRRSATHWGSSAPVACR